MDLDPKVVGGAAVVTVSAVALAWKPILSAIIWLLALIRSAVPADTDDDAPPQSYDGETSPPTPEGRLPRDEAARMMHQLYEHFRGNADGEGLEAVHTAAGCFYGVGRSKQLPDDHVPGPPDAPRPDKRTEVG